eukprot:902053-Pleurochrysis_carterae.AAC.1
MLLREQGERFGCTPRLNATDLAGRGSSVARRSARPVEARKQDAHTVKVEWTERRGPSSPRCLPHSLREGRACSAWVPYSGYKCKEARIDHAYATYLICKPHSAHYEL